MGEILRYSTNHRNDIAALDTFDRIQYLPDQQSETTEKIEDGDKLFKKSTYQCEDCLNTFAAKPNLLAHIKGVHEKKKDNICEQCEYETPHRSNLKRHMKMVHQSDDQNNC